MHFAPQAAYKAVDDYVKSGTAIGLGTGSTSFFAGKGKTLHRLQRYHLFTADRFGSYLPGMWTNNDANRRALQY